MRNPLVDLVKFPVRIGHQVLVDAGDALGMPSRSKRRLPRIAALAPFLPFYALCGRFFSHESQGKNWVSGKEAAGNLGEAADEGTEEALKAE